MSEHKIETRAPSGEKWVRLVGDVPPTAKTGHDWAGEFLASGRLVDLPPGTVVAACDNAGSRNHPRPEVRLCVLLADGTWIETTPLDSKEWAYEFRGLARALLAARGNQPLQQRLILDQQISAARADVKNYTARPNFERALADAKSKLQQLETELALLPSPTARDAVDPELLDLAAKLRACVNAQRAKTKTAAAHDAIADALSHLDLLDRAIIDINDE